jgi:hypothetical protein
MRFCGRDPRWSRGWATDAMIFYGPQHRLPRLVYITEGHLQHCNTRCRLVLRAIGIFV